MQHHKKEDNLFLKKKIMKKIYFIWLIKKMTSNQMIKIITPFIIIPFTFYQIDIFSVIKNATGSSSSFNDFLRFFLNNFQLAETINKLTVSILIIFTGIVFWDVVRRGAPSSFLRKEI